MSGRKKGWQLSPRIWIPCNLNQGSLSVDLKEFELNGKPLPKADWTGLNSTESQTAIAEWGGELYVKRVSNA